MLRKIKTKLLFQFSKLFQPIMIGNFETSSGIKLSQTRISNTTYIGCKENLKIENNVFIGHFNFIDACNGITINEGCQITNYISILTHSSHISIRLYGKEYVNHKDLIGYVKGSVYIGAYSFIGPHSTIMPNTKIGKGCLISAYSYLQGEFPDFSVISGNPAKVIGDTRLMDTSYLKEYPELQKYYDEWTK